MSSNDDILKDFQAESRRLIAQLTEILDNCEGDISKIKDIELYGQIVDRMMGGAKSLVMLVAQKNGVLAAVGDYTAICKVVAYKVAGVKDDEKLYNIAVPVLADATEALKSLIECMFDEDPRPTKDIVSQTLIDRVKWVSAQVDERKFANAAGRVKMNQGEIDTLIKKLGL